jgi:hypothetical protein
MYLPDDTSLGVDTNVIDEDLGLPHDRRSFGGNHTGRDRQGPAKQSHCGSDSQRSKTQHEQVSLVAQTSVLKTRFVASDHQAQAYRRDVRLSTSARAALLLMPAQLNICEEIAVALSQQIVSTSGSWG